MRIAVGILMIIGAVVLAAVGFSALSYSVPLVLSGEGFGFIRAVPALLVLLLAFLLAFGGYRVLKRKKRGL